MKRTEVRAGMACAYSEARSYSILNVNFRPYLILDTRPHTISRDDNGGHLVLAEPNARLVRGRSWGDRRPVGIPAIEVIARAGHREDSGYDMSVLGELRARQDALLGGWVLSAAVASSSGRDLGRCRLVTSLSYLHGEYSAVMEAQAGLHAAEREAQRARDAEKAGRLAEYQGLSARLAALGIVIDAFPVEHDPPRKVELDYEDARVLISLAEYARQESRS